MSTGVHGGGGWSGPWPEQPRIYNRPGLAALAYRLGTHSSFLEEMLSKLSLWRIDTGDGDAPATRPLALLKTRALEDPAIAWMDAWACIADVLTFYQERIANEGFLRTARERFSCVQIARLVGYEPQPGVASSVFLAYTVDQNTLVSPPAPLRLVIPKGAKVMTIPGPGELPQTFETSDELPASSSWNVLKPRMSKPQTERSILDLDQPVRSRRTPRIYTKGTGAALRPNDPLLLRLFGKMRLFRVVKGTPHPSFDRTEWVLRQEDDFATKDTFDNALSPVLKAWRSLANVLRIDAAVVKGVLARFPEEPEDRQKLLKDAGSVATDLRRLVKPGSSAATREWLETVAVDIVALAEEYRDVIPAPIPPAEEQAEQEDSLYARLGGALQRESVPPPQGSAALVRSPGEAFAPASGATLSLAGSFDRRVAEALPAAVATAPVTPEPRVRAVRFQLATAPFGSLARIRMRFSPDGGTPEPVGEWPVVEWSLSGDRHAPPFHMISHEEDPCVLDLAIEAPQLTPTTKDNESWVVTSYASVRAKDEPRAERRVAPPNDDSPMISRVLRVETIIREDYGLNLKTTRVTLDRPWLFISKKEPTPEEDRDKAMTQRGRDLDFATLRATTVLAQSEPIDLGEAPLTAAICGAPGEWIELDRMYENLDAGRWVIVSGERMLITGVGGHGSEVAMLSRVEHRFDADLPGDRVHTFVQFATPLAFCYKRTTVTIHGNVVKATHGDTRSEILGSGDAGKEYQVFSLRQPPLTYTSAPTPRGIASSLEIWVNNIRWKETNAFSSASETDRVYQVKNDESGGAEVIFGNGMNGARLPTGQENVRASYRSGIGRAGNVRAEQISLLGTRVLGLKSVVNPLPATGGAERDTAEEIRSNAPLWVGALERLVSTEDYGAFARTFAGVGKALATRVSDGQRRLVHVTIAGEDDVPIDTTSDLYRNLLVALRTFGDAFVPVEVDVRERVVLVASADVSILPDHDWEAVERAIRQRVLEEFGFVKRELAQPAYLSHFQSVIQSVPGVAYVDVDVFTGVTAAEALDPGVLADRLGVLVKQGEADAWVDALAAEPVATAKRGAGERNPRGRVLPAQLTMFVREIPETLILNQVKP
jgi:hypothetical protein